MSIWKAEPRVEVRRLSSDMFMNALIVRLYSELVEKDWTYKELANACGLCYEEISQILRRKKKEIKLETLFKISNGLGINASALLASIEKSKGGGING